MASQAYPRDVGRVTMAMCVDTKDGQVGSVYFTQSIEVFADNDIGDGAEIDLLLAHGDTGPNTPVVIQWIDWNHFLWQATGKGTVVDDVRAWTGH